jgi:DNA-binding response OmpR family regulator
MLLSLGCSVTETASDLPTALTLAANTCADVALLDLMLRDKSAFDVAKLLLTRSIPVILATGMDDGFVPAMYKGLPMLGKPFGVEELSAVLRTVIDHPLTDDHAVRLTAYFLWEHDGRPDGGAEHYWARAVAFHERSREADDLLQRRPDPG